MKAQQFYDDMVESHSPHHYRQHFVDHINLGMPREGILYMGMEFEDGSVLGAYQDWPGPLNTNHFEVFATRLEAVASWLSGPNYMRRSGLFVSSKSRILEQLCFTTYNHEAPAYQREAVFCDTACQ